MNKRRRAWDAQRSKAAPTVICLISSHILKNSRMAVKLSVAVAKRGIPHRNMPRTSFRVRQMPQNARSPAPQ
jgi:hypothetical protein